MPEAGEEPVAARPIKTDVTRRTFTTVPKSTNGHEAAGHYHYTSDC